MAALAMARRGGRRSPLRLIFAQRVLISDRLPPNEGTETMTEETARAEERSSPGCGDGKAGARADVETLSRAAEFKRQVPAFARRHGKSAQADRTRGQRIRACMASPALPATLSGSPTISAARRCGAASDAGGFTEARAKALMEGVELTERELLKALEKNGIAAQSAGCEIRPQCASGDVRSTGRHVPAGCVVQVVQPGYMMADRVLRPAMVGVSKGGPKAAPPHQSFGESHLN